MNDKNIEAFFEEIEKTRAELVARRNAAWDNALKEINGILDQAGYDPTSPTRNSMILVMQVSWIQGYDRGVQDVSDFVARQSGLGPTMDKVYQKLSSKPENN